jgi:hypothetical protein
MGSANVKGPLPKQASLLALGSIRMFLESANGGNPAGAEGQKKLSL